MAAIGALIRQRHLFAPVGEQVTSAQKTVQYTPQDKLYDALIAILAAAPGIVEVTTRGAAPCRCTAPLAGAAAPNNRSETLDACTTENVQQVEQALNQIYRQHSQGYRHDYQQGWQLLDADMSGLACGRKAAFASKG